MLYPFKDPLTEKIFQPSLERMASSSRSLPTIPFELRDSPSVQSMVFFSEDSPGFSVRTIENCIFPPCH